MVGAASASAVSSTVPEQAVRKRESNSMEASWRDKTKEISRLRRG
jgi:hypothetical protein